MSELTQIIKSDISRYGPISFRKFVELALYHKNYGYYRSGKAEIGKAGDYYTAATVHSSFGKVLSNFVAKAYGLINEESFSIIELGGGYGYLALDILDELKRNFSTIYKNITYSIIEINPSANKFSKKLLKKHTNKIKWFPSVDGIENNSLNGVIISNEFFDALPFHRIKFINNKYYEIYVSLNGKDELEDFYVQLNNDYLFKYIKNYIVDPLEGMEFEINLEVKWWLEKIDVILNKGLILTIDYGHLSDELYSEKNLKGSYKCFFNHQLEENPYQNIGFQDITSDVNFSEIIRLGESLGLKKTKYTNQSRFLIDWGIIKIAENFSDANQDKDRLAIKTLIMPNLMGDKFKFLIQSKKISSEQIQNFYKESDFKLSLKVD